MRTGSAVSGTKEDHSGCQTDEARHAAQRLEPGLFVVPPQEVRLLRLWIHARSSEKKILSLSGWVSSCVAARGLTFLSGGVTVPDLRLSWLEDAASASSSVASAPSEFSLVIQRNQA